MPVEPPVPAAEPPCPPVPPRAPPDAPPGPDAPPVELAPPPPFAPPGPEPPTPAVVPPPPDRPQVAELPPAPVSLGPPLFPHPSSAVASKTREMRLDMFDSRKRWISWPISRLRGGTRRERSRRETRHQGLTWLLQCAGAARPIRSSAMWPLPQLNKMHRSAKYLIFTRAQEGVTWGASITASRGPLSLCVRCFELA